MTRYVSPASSGLCWRREEHDVDCVVGADVSSGQNEAKPAQESVLVVEDEILIRYVICDYLRECGYKVIEASNADEALSVLQEGSIGVDVVLGAVQMAG